MRRNNRRAAHSFLLPAVMAAFAVSAHAQQGTSPGANPGQQQMQPSQQAQAPQSQYRAMRAGDLVGADVRNAQGQDIGQIEDLIVSLRDGSVQYAVLSVDPGWFQSERLFSVPPRMLRFGESRDQIVLNESVTKEQLEQGGIERSQWTPRFVTNQEQVGRINRAWNEQRQQARLGQTQSGQQQAQQRAAGQQTASGARLIRASDLMDRDIYNRRGERVAELDELVLNTAQGRVHYAVVSFNRGWLQEDRRTVLPLSAMQYDARRDRLVTNISQQQARSMARFDERQYQNLNDPAYVADVDRYLITIPAAVVTLVPGGQTQQMGAPAQQRQTQGSGATQR